jgi:hypothetical protein
MRNGKLATIVVFVTLSGGVVTPIIFGKLYPVTNIWFTAGILALISLALNDTELGQTVWLYLGCIITLAVAYRLRIFLFPASMIGMDPDTYAIQIARVMEAGEASAITFGFYGQASLHILKGTITGLITALPAPAASVVYPIASGIAMPLVAASLTHRLRPDAPEATVLATGVVSVLGYSVRFSYWPLAQSTGVLFLLFTLVLIFAYATTGDKRWLISGILAMLGAVYTHKLSAVATTLSVTGAVLLGIVHPATRRSKEVKRLATGAFWIIALLTAVQLLFLTEFIRAIAFQLYGPSVSGSPPSNPGQAIDPYTFTDRMFALSYVILMGLISGLVWLSTCWRTVRNRGPPRDILFLGFVSPLAALVIVLYPAGVNPVRTIFYVEVLLAVLIAVGGCWIVESVDSSRPFARYAAVVGILMLVVSAGVSPTAGPDWDTLNRNYLTAEEVEAKEWGHDKVFTTIITDQYYASETIPSRISSIGSEEESGSAQFDYLPGYYIYAEFSDSESRMIAHRGCLDILRTSIGPMKLTYDPSNIFDPSHNKVYNSGCVYYYRTD